MANTATFWDRIANFYSKQPVSDEASYQKKLAITRDYFEPHMKVLEFGCGTGSTALNHASYVKHIHAIDVSAKMLAIAQTKADEKSITNVTFEQSNIDDFKTTKPNLDAVMGHSILHLVENKEDVIVKVHEMLKPGGVFISSTLCMGNRMKLLKAILPIGNLFGLLPRVKFFTEENLTSALTAAGFEIDQKWQPGEGKSLFIVAKKKALR